MNKTRPVPINSALTGPPIPVQAKIAAAYRSPSWGARTLAKMSPANRT